MVGSISAQIDSLADDAHLGRRGPTMLHQEVGQGPADGDHRIGIGIVGPLQAVLWGGFVSGWLVVRRLLWA